jgi:uncharacterized protein
LVIGRSRGARVARAIAAACGAAGLVGCASAFVLHPTRGPSGSAEAQRFIDSPSGRLEALVERHGDPGCEPAMFVLEFTGNSGQAGPSTLPERVLDAAPMEVWVVNYPGYGASEGRRRLRAIPPAARAAYDAVARRAAGRPIVAYGYSLGSLAALHLAGTRPVAGAVFRNVPCLVHLFMWRFGWWNLWLAAIPTAAQIPREMSCGWSARLARAPGLFLMSERDEICPLRYQRSAFRRYAGPKRAVLMRGAHHNDPVPDAAAEELVDWISRTVGPRLPPAGPDCRRP